MDKLEGIKEAIINYLKLIYDPEIPINIYELGLIYLIDVKEVEGKVHCIIDMTLTAPSCPVADSLIDQVSQVDKVVEGIDALEVNLVFDPPWNQDNISYEAKLELGLL